MAKRKIQTRVTALSSDRIAQSILSIRGHKVMLDEDLAALYEVETKVLNQAVKRNIERFPDDFMFPLSSDEINSLRSQIVTLKRGRHRKYAPRAFTGQNRDRSIFLRLRPMSILKPDLNRDMWC